MNILRNLVFAILVSSASYAKSETPCFINTQANVITPNGANWSSLTEKFRQRAAGDSSVIRILHIGDSHIQAEMVTNELRRLLQAKYGNAGRGLMMPLRLAGTNQSHDYTATSPVKDVKQTRLLKLPWPVAPGVTGVAFQPGENTTVTWHPKCEGHKIKSAKLLSSKGITDVSPVSSVDSLTTDIAAGESVYGLLTDNGKPGVLYSAIGNNGACYNDYLLINKFAEQTPVFAPDLIVLSMGTNEAFSYMTDDEITRSVHDVIRLLHYYNPDAQLLVLTPMECQKNRNHGHKPLSPYYDILLKNKEVAELIKAECQRLSVPVWDFYTVAGGDGASNKWIDANLFSRDRIHLVNNGYVLQANLLFKALTESLR